MSCNKVQHGILSVKSYITIDNYVVNHKSQINTQKKCSVQKTLF